MARLSDDCFAFGGALTTIEEAHALFGERLVTVVGTEDVPVENADGRILAADCVAPIDVPPFPNSAVDGYAVRFADLGASSSRAIPSPSTATKRSGRGRSSKPSGHDGTWPDMDIAALASPL